MADYISIGRITGALALKGEMKIKPLVNAEEIFLDVDKVFINKKEYKVLSARKYKTGWVMALDGIKTPEEVEKLRSVDIQIDARLMPEIEDDEVYWADIVNSTVVDQNGKELGTLVDYIETGSNDVFRVKMTDDEYFLISNNRTHVLEIDVKNKKITVNTDGIVLEKE